MLRTATRFVSCFIASVAPVCRLMKTGRLLRSIPRRSLPILALLATLTGTRRSRLPTSLPRRLFWRRISRRSRPHTPSGSIQFGPQRHIARGRREGRWSDVETAARLCLATDPLNEEATLALAEAIAMGGSKADALRLLDAYIWELGDREKTIGLPAKLLRRRISDQPSFRTQPSGEPPLVARADDLAWLNTQLDTAATGVSHTVGTDRVHR